MIDQPFLGHGFTPNLVTLIRGPRNRTYRLVIGHVFCPLPDPINLDKVTTINPCLGLDYPNPRRQPWLQNEVN